LGWKEIGEKVSREVTAWLPERRRIGTAKISKIDQRIAALENKPESTRRNNAIKKLWRERAEIEALYFSGVNIAGERDIAGG
jgi:hypothetical protein